MKRRKVAVIGFCALIAILLVLVNYQRQRAESPVVNSAMTEKTAEDLRSLGYISEAEEPSSVAARTPPPASRKLVRSGEVSIKVNSADMFVRTLDEHIREAGGYIAALETNHPGANNGSAVVTMRVPPDRVNAMLWWLREQGDILSEKIQSEDVSDQYYDLVARLDNARKYEIRLQELAKSNAGSLKELLEVEEKLSAVREQIEIMEARSRNLDQLTSLTTIRLKAEAEPPANHTRVAAYSERLSKAWISSIRSLLDFSQLVGLILVVSLPWCLAMLLVALPAFLLLRARSRRAASEVSL